ncbi:13959_t:CDS:1 [Racocetra fulgida]|uniref:13959_t:CDS:1 n=1 Tax=Racocetra fulgida TaxID=60492 RepID=A0A9N9EAD3_9GLOM|nr:13959_t:CDS:1 [Racocetra fulgida]
MQTCRTRNYNDNEKDDVTIYREYLDAKVKYQSIRSKLFNVIADSSDYENAFKTYQKMEDDVLDVFSYRIKYKIGLHLLSGISCTKDVNKGYRKIVEAGNFGLPDAILLINKYRNVKDHGAQEAFKLLNKH